MKLIRTLANANGADIFDLSDEDKAKVDSLYNGYSDYAVVVLRRSMTSEKPKSNKEIIEEFEPYSTLGFVAFWTRMLEIIDAKIKDAKEKD